MFIEASFKKHIEYLDIESIENSPDVIYVIDDQMVLRAYNQAWINFANNNNGGTILENFSIGFRISDAFPEPLKSHVVAAYQQALDQNKPCDHDFECPSPIQYRLYHQTAYPLVESKGLVISNHLVKEFPHPDGRHDFEEQFASDWGIITQCCNCRKIRDPENEQMWLWVPLVVEKPVEKTSHGICPRCYDHYYAYLKN